jgi:hypothetical protein
VINNSRLHKRVSTCGNESGTAGNCECFLPDELLVARPIHKLSGSYGLKFKMSLLGTEIDELLLDGLAQALLITGDINYINEREAYVKLKPVIICKYRRVIL